MAAREHKRARCGLATVEMALLLPVMLWLTCGIIDYGLWFSEAEDVADAARAGARMAARAGTTSADVTALVQSMMTSAGLDQSGYTCVPTPTEVGDQKTGQDVKVEIIVPYTNISLYWPVPNTISSSASMAREGP